MRRKTTTKRDKSPVEAALSTAILNPRQAAGLPLQRRVASGFTLAELLVSVGVLVLLVFLSSQLVNSTATLTTLGDRRMDADSQARQLLDRMAVDFAQMVKRSDLDFFGKGTTAPNSAGGAMVGNDQIAFFSAVPGYYPPTGSQSPLSLVAYRVNSNSNSASYNKMERMGKGLVWNGVSSTDAPVVFMPLTIGPCTLPDGRPWPGTWPTATSSSASDSTYEVIGPQVFRFEYCYLRTDGTLSITPPGITSMAAILVDIAVIDPKSKVLLSDAQITSLAGQLVDYAANMVPGQLRNNWQNTLNTNTTLPRRTLSAVRLYERFFYLSPPTL